MGFLDRFTKGWNAFMNRDPPETTNYQYVSSSRPDTVPLPRAYERSIVNSIYNRISIDVSQIVFRHSRVDDNGKYLSTLNTDLNRCLSLSANIDQIGQEIMQNFVHTILVDGVAALCPIVTDKDPETTDGIKIKSIRVGKIVEWAPRDIKVDCYDERDGQHHEIWMPKDTTAIVQNPFYDVMNEPNSTLKRLIRKLALMDAIDEESSVGKLNLIIQLPYTIRGDARRQQAEDRRKEIQEQLTKDKLGVAYTDGTEHVVQLNRPLENNMLKQIEYLTNLAFSQLSMTQGVLDGTANEETMSNYIGQVIEVFANKIATEMSRKFLSPTALSQHQYITYFRDPFRLVPITKFADLAQKLTTAAILSSNECRQGIGLKPSQDKQADELSNKNITPGGGETPTEDDGEDSKSVEGTEQSEPEFGNQITEGDGNA